MSEYSYDKAPTNPHHGGKMTPTDMVRYIQELETRLRSLSLERVSDLAQAQEAYEQVVELEAKLVRYGDLVADKINLRSENADLKAKLAKATAGLTRIAHPINALLEDAECRGESVNAAVVLQLSESHEYLKQVARNTIEELTGGKDE